MEFRDLRIARVIDRSDNRDECPFLDRPDLNVSNGTVGRFHNLIAGGPKGRRYVRVNLAR